MRSSRSHTGPRPLSDFTYIDEDPTNSSSGQSGAGKLPSKASPEQNQEHEANYRGTRIQSQNSSASPLLLTVTGPANAYNHHYTTNTTNDNRPTTNYSLNNQAHEQANHALQSSNNRETTGNSLLLSSNNLPVSELSKVVHETSI